jgi:hypothetical protein
LATIQLSHPLMSFKYLVTSAIVVVISVLNFSIVVSAHVVCVPGAAEEGDEDGVASGQETVTVSGTRGRSTDEVVKKWRRNMGGMI